MLVSIVIPVYRSRKYIEKCVRSVLDQTYKDIEIIIVDDYSTDKSVQYIKDLQDDGRWDKLDDGIKRLLISQTFNCDTLF